MLLIPLIIFLIILNLIAVVTENNLPYYKDVRFWLIMISLVVLIARTVDGYPLK